MRPIFSRLLAALVLASLVAGCGREPARTSPGTPAEDASTEAASTDAILSSEAVQRDLEQVARRQSKGLQGAVTTVHRAFRYGGGNTNRADQAADGQQVVAVDVEFRGFHEGFDLDDVDIVDGASGKNFGSGPQMRLLRSDGTLEQNNAKWDSAGDSLRVLLIYTIPKETTSIKLAYWGDQLTAAATPITAGEWTYGESRVAAGLEFWRYPTSYQAGDSFDLGRWLVVRLSVGSGAAVMDLEAWPPAIRHWDCNVLKDIKPAPQGGWIVISRTGSTADDIRFPVWHHVEPRPGDSPLAGAAASPGEHLQGIAIVGGSVFAYEDKVLYRFAGGRLARVEGLDSPHGVEHRFGVEYTHGQITLGDGRSLLLWDGDAYELSAGQLTKSWSTKIDESHDFATVPWGPDGLYYLRDREVFRVKPGTTAEPCMTGVENVMGLRPGPAGSILFNLGDNDAGFVAGIWFPDDDRYVPVHIGELSAELESHNISTIHWSPSTRHFYFVARDGVFTVPEDRLLKRERVKLADPSHEQDGKP